MHQGLRTRPGTARWPANRPCRNINSQSRRVVCQSTATSARSAPAAPYRPLDVIIVGGGIGGLTAAAALLEAGARVRVFETRKKADALTGPGGIQLQANAEKVLRLLGSPWPAPRPGHSSTLSDAIYEVGGPIMSGGFRSDRGDYLYYADVDSTGLADQRSNGLSISRTSLQNILHGALPAGSVTFGRGFSSFTAPPSGEPGRVQVAFDDGGVEECDVLVGADGLRSKVRAQLVGGPVELQYSGTVCWTGRLPLSRIGNGAESVLKAINNNSWAEFWGKGNRIGMFTVGREVAADATAPGGLQLVGEPQLAWYAFANLPETWRAEPGSDEVARLRELFRGFASPVPELLAALEASAVQTVKVFYHQPRQDPWGAGRVTLLGDAAHAMMPTLGQGGCMAVEDALELANDLGAAVAAGGEPAATSSYDAAAVGRLEAALRRYEASRAPRTAQVTEQSRQVGQLAMADTALTVWVRNTIYRLTPKWAGDKQFEYLFKDYVPAWKDGVRLGRSFPEAAAAATPAAASGAASL